MKTNIYGLIVSVFLFLIFIVLAIKFESTAYLYTASFLPLIIVLFLPDIRSSQYINTGKQTQQVRLIKLRGTGEAEAVFVIAFAPGYVKWRKKHLYLNVKDAVTYAALLPEEYIVSMPVLKFDLTPHPRKKTWVGISLPQLADRTKQLHFTTDEVNRFVIQMEDLNEVLQLPSKRSSSTDQSLHA
jgi:uncharacterized integral membrane protein